MCRSIQTLRPPFHDEATAEEIRAAALQYVRKVSGFRTPAPHNARAFQAAVDAIAAATERLLADLVVRGPAPEAGPPSRTPSRAAVPHAEEPDVSPT